MAAGNNAPQLQTPFAPDNYGGGYEGSDLQRAMRNPNLIRDAAMNPPVYQDNTTYQQPLYPYTVGLNGNSPYGYGYGYNPYWYGSGWWWGGGSDVIVINNGGNGHGHDHGDHHHDGWRGNAGSWNGGGNWHGGGNSGGGGFTPVADTNGQAIRRAATWMGNAPSTMTHTMAGPQLVPGISGAMNNVPRGGPQLVPSGSGAMNNVPRGGPQMVPGAAVTAGRGGGGGAAVSGGAGGRR
jgi:hypothetical protein